MNVLFLTKTLARNCGGGRMSYEIVSRVQKHSDVLVCTERDAGESFEHAILTTSGLFGIVKSIIRVRRLAQSYDIVHALDGWPFGLIALGAVFGTKKKLFVSGVGTYTIRPLDTWYKRILLKMVYLRAKEIFCISTYVKDELLKRIPKAKATVVHLGTTTFPKVSDQDLHQSTQKYDIPSGVPIVLTVGAVKDRKGQYDTVRAVHMLTKTYPTIRYYIVGSLSDVVYVNKIRKYIAEHELTGHIFLVDDAKTDSDLAYFYSKATVFALNSNNGDGHFEGFGLVFLEAAQFGVPGVGSRGCGIEDAIKDGVTGHLAPQRDGEAIADALQKVIENHAVYTKNALDWPKHFSWDDTARRYMEGYRN